MASVAAIAAFWTHYTAALVLAPMLLWIATRAGVPRRERAASIVAVVVVSSLAAPLMFDQLGRGHEGGVAPISKLTLANLIQVIGTPFDGRSERLTVWIVVGAATVGVAALAALRDRGAVRSLILPMAIVPVAAVLVQTVASDDILISRYTAVSAPFMIVLIAGLVTEVLRSPGAVVAGLALICAAAGSLDLHRQATFYPDMREAFATIGADYASGDVIAVSGYPGLGPIGVYYRDREVRGAPVIAPGQRPQLETAVREGRRLWIVTSEVPSRASLEGTARSFGYRLRSGRRLPSPLADLWVGPIVPQGAALSRGAELEGRVALVAGATRGAGRGIAVALGEAGATVYCTGRTTRERRSEYDRPETIEETAELVDAAGGTGIAVAVDHLEREQVAALVERIDADHGRLDVLVNDIWGGEKLFEWDTHAVGARPGCGPAPAAAGRGNASGHQPRRPAAADPPPRRPGGGDHRRHPRLQRHPTTA